MIIPLLSGNGDEVTDGEGSIVVLMSLTVDVGVGKVDDSSSGQFPLTSVVE